MMKNNFSAQKLFICVAFLLSSLSLVHCGGKNPTHTPSPPTTNENQTPFSKYRPKSESMGRSGFSGGHGSLLDSE